MTYTGERCRESGLFIYALQAVKQAGVVGQVHRSTFLFGEVILVFKNACNKVKDMGKIIEQLGPASFIIVEVRDVNK